MIYIAFISFYFAPFCIPIKYQNVQNSYIYNTLHNFVFLPINPLVNAYENIPIDFILCYKINNSN